MKRKIITIDEEKCTGCGVCIPDCPEGALQILDGKARLVSDLFCDGLGACIGTCPEGAISVIERDAEPYDERTVMENIVRQGESVIEAHLKHLKSHGENEFYQQAVAYLQEKQIPIPGCESSCTAPAQPPYSGGCPGARAQMVHREPRTPGTQAGVKIESELQQWPVQLRLLNPSSPFFENADLLVAADCVPFAYADFHREFLRNKILVIFCPKLDTDPQEYIEKLTRIFTEHQIKSVTAVHMEVPCCSGITALVTQALTRSGRTIPFEDVTITLQGAIKQKP